MPRLTDRPRFAAEAAVNLRALLLVAVSVALMALDKDNHYLEPVRGALNTALYPLQRLITLPFDGAAALSEILAERSALLEENRRLRRRQLFLKVRLQRLTALEAENRRLRRLLESSVRLGQRALVAELLRVDFDPYRHQILLDKGTRHGVAAGQPLLDEDGIVGQVVHAAPLSSTAILITDPNHALPVQVNRNGLRTLAVGTGNFQALDLPHVPNNDDVQVGDLLVTSGLGGRFPRDYPVARVVRVEFDPGRPFARITARPSAKLDRRRKVLVIVEQPAAGTGEESPAADGKGPEPVLEAPPS